MVRDSDERERSSKCRGREGEEIAMNMSVLPNGMGGAVFIASNGTPT